MDEHEYYEVKISAEDMGQAEKILNSLLAKKLVTGGQFVQSPARFLWEGEINDMPEYVTITSYTTSAHVSALIDDVRETTEEAVPMVTFVTPAAMNSELQDWIDATLESGAASEPAAQTVAVQPDSEPQAASDTYPPPTEGELDEDDDYGSS